MEITLAVECRKTNERKAENLHTLNNFSSMRFMKRFLREIRFREYFVVLNREKMCRVYIIIFLYFIYQEEYHLIQMEKYEVNLEKTKRKIRIKYLFYSKFFDISLKCI